MRRLFFALMMAFGLAFATNARAQNPVDEVRGYIERQKTGIENKLRGDELDSFDQDSWDWNEIRYEGWKSFGNNLAVKVNWTSLDSLIDPIPPPDNKGQESWRYYLKSNVTFRAKRDRETADGASGFSVKDSYGKTMRTSDYEGRDVNGSIKMRSGGKKFVSMYEKLNPGKLRQLNPNTGPSDEFTVGTSKGSAITRTLCFAVGVNEIYGRTDGSMRRISPYLRGPVYLCHEGRAIDIYNLDWRETIYETEQGQEQESYEPKKLNLNDRKVRNYFNYIKTFFADQLEQKIELTNYKIAQKDIGQYYITFYFNSSRFEADSVHVLIEKNDSGKWQTLGMEWYLRQLPQNKSPSDLPLPPRGIELD